MKSVAIILTAILFPLIPARAQENPGKVLEIAEEPHHSLLLQNDEVRVYRLKLQPGEVTLPHRHKSFYAYLSVTPATIGNEVRGRPPVITKLVAGELHTSKGGFNLAERNNSPQPVDLLIIEPARVAGAGFTTPMGGFRFHDAVFGELFEAPVMRGYTMTIAVGGHTEPHREAFDRLIVAVSNLGLRETLDGRTPSEFEMKAGEIRWEQRGATSAIENIGTSPATFITLEFN
jgi:quercetin dioxygenase-like cupin family protein